MATEFIKDPNAVLDYESDWTVWLATSETITTSTWPVVPTGITKDSDSNTTTTATIWLSGGTAGEDYRCTNRIVTNQGRTNERSILIMVRDQ